MSLLVGANVITGHLALESLVNVGTSAVVGIALVQLTITSAFAAGGVEDALLAGLGVHLTVGGRGIVKNGVAHLGLVVGEAGWHAGLLHIAVLRGALGSVLICVFANHTGLNALQVGGHGAAVVGARFLVGLVKDHQLAELVFRNGDVLSGLACALTAGDLNVDIVQITEVVDFTNATIDLVALQIGRAIKGKKSHLLFAGQLARLIPLDLL